jgi:hypothetical protein
MPDDYAVNPQDHKVVEEILKTLIILGSEITFTDIMPQTKKQRVQFFHKVHVDKGNICKVQFYYY